MPEIITLAQLRQIMPNLKPGLAEEYLPHLNAALVEFEVNTPVRVAAFVAQVAHESGELKWWAEIWGPTDAQKRYEPPGKKAKDLGNVERHDGKRYRGRGPIQITGRANYRRYGEMLGLPLEMFPEQAAKPEAGFRIAGAFWKLNKLNALADADEFQSITKRINGGLNGLAERVRYYAKAKAALGCM